MTEDLALEALTEFLNACEAGITAARQRIKEVKGLYDSDKIKWTKREGPSGEYERSEDVDNPDFKALMKDLEAHNGKIMRNGFFFWKFDTAEAVIGRKKRK